MREKGERGWREEECKRQGREMTKQGEELERPQRCNYLLLKFPRRVWG